MNNLFPPFDRILSNYEIIYCDFSGLPRLLLRDCSSFWPISDKLLSTVAICDKCEVLSMSEKFVTLLIILFDFICIILSILYTLFFYFMCIILPILFIVSTWIILYYSMIYIWFIFSYLLSFYLIHFYYYIRKVVTIP